MPVIVIQQPLKILEIMIFYWVISEKHPTEIMENHLDNNIGIIATHPMFGPDSFISNNRLKNA